MRKWKATHAANAANPFTSDTHNQGLNEHQPDSTGTRREKTKKSAQQEAFRTERLKGKQQPSCVT